MAVLFLLWSPKKTSWWTQTCRADDSSCVAALPDSHELFDRLKSQAPDFEYYPEPTKSVLVVDSKDIPAAQEFSM